MSNSVQAQQQYQVLARKYRPNNFHELVGQTHVSKALINAIDYNRLHHAYLFTGTRGVGKTTIARILAKCLNCDAGITSKPCGTCNSCQMIEQGRFIDLIEIDAASRTKVEDTRELLDNVPYAPTQGRYKVYLIDEVHMLSTHSFNALLKTLEEPPEHVKFLLATTDPQKLPITIISRCLQFVLRPLAQQQLTDHLRKLLTLENIEFEESALWQLAHSAKGSVRDSLSLTDQAIAFGEGRLTEQIVNDMLGLITGADLISLLTDIYNDDKNQVASHIEQMRMQMVDASSIFDEMADFIHKISLMQVLPTIGLNVNESQSNAIRQLANNISAEVLQLYYEIVVKSRENIAIATTPMQALEMCLLRMLAFRPLPINQMVRPISLDMQQAPIEQAPIEQAPIEQAPIEQAPIEQAPIEQAPVEQAPVEQAPIEQAPIEQAPIEQAPIEQAPVEQAPVEQAPIEQAPIEQAPIEQAPIEQAPIEQAPIEQTPIEQTPIEQTPIEQTPVEQAPIEVSLIDDPRKLLKCQPVELIKEWTAEKWDYWVQQARDNQWLDKDELAFARQGMMTGQCDGESLFITNLDSDNFQVLFDSFTEKLQEQFSNASYQLNTSQLQVTEDATEESKQTNKNLEETLPQSRQNQRKELAKQVAIEKLDKSPAVQKLREVGGIANIRTAKLIEGQ